MAVSSVSLTVVGDTDFNPGYTRHLVEITERYGISDRVRFAGKVVPEEIGGYLGSHGLLSFLQLGMSLSASHRWKRWLPA